MALEEKFYLTPTDDPVLDQNLHHMGRAISEIRKELINDVQANEVRYELHKDTTTELNHRIKRIEREIQDIHKMFIDTQALIRKIGMEYMKVKWAKKKKVV